MELMSAYVIKKVDSGFNVKRLAFENGVLEKLELTLEIPSFRKMINLDELSESFENSNKYFVQLESDKKNWYFETLTNIFGLITNAELLQRIRDAYANEKLDYQMVGYLFQDKENLKDKALYVYSFNDGNAVKDVKSFLVINKKYGSTNANAAEVIYGGDTFSLPLNKKQCLVSFHSKEDEGRVIYKVNVYQAYEFDNQFGNNEIQKKYIENTLNNFSNNNGYKIASEEVKVNFSNGISQEIRNEVYKNEKIKRTFVNFHNNGRRTIQRISVNQLQDVLERLKNYIENNADVPYKVKNIPKLTDDNELIVDEDSIKVFAALLDNKIVEKLLDHKINIPYF